MFKNNNDFNGPVDFNLTYFWQSHLYDLVKTKVQHNTCMCVRVYVCVQRERESNVCKEAYT